MIARRDPPSGAARIGLVLVHGRGASARSMLDLARHLAIPDLLAVAPEAPGMSWWPTSFLAPMAQMQASLEAGLAAVAGAVAALEAEGLARNRIAVAGFSQGACLALEFAARHGTGLHSVTGWSGGLVGTADASDIGEPALLGFAPKRFDYRTPLEGTAAHLSVHQQDPHIPMLRVRETAVVFDRLGAHLTSRILPGAGHGFDESEMAAMRARLGA